MGTKEPHQNIKAGNLSPNDKGSDPLEDPNIVGKTESKTPKLETTKKPKENYNKFILRDIFPDAKELFTHTILSIEQIKGDCLIVLDTNVLLLPYQVGANSLNEIGTVYKNLSQDDRIYIPVQVLREFASNRGTKLSESYQNLLTFKSKLLNNINYKLEKNLLLENLQEYAELKVIEKEIKETHKQYIDKIDTLIAHAKCFAWNDPVSMLYSEVFNKNIVDLNLSDEFVESDLANRNEHNIPPGYKDKGKPDVGIGDFLIWHSILQIGKELKRHVIFVTHDSKADWWQRGAGQPLFPRYELVDEFRRMSDGKTFQMSNFSDFLSIFNVDQQVIKEVKNEESVKNVALIYRYSSLVDNTYKLVDEIKALISKAEQQSSEARYARSFRPIWAGAVYEYKNNYRNRAIELRDTILSILSIDLDIHREYLYLQSNADEVNAPNLQAIVDDLTVLAAQLIHFFAE